MELNDNILNKLLKLKELVERGERGEALNAKRVLDNLLVKYNISLEEIFYDKENIQEYKINYHSALEKTLLIQCTAKLFGSDSQEWKNLYRYKNGKMQFCIKTSHLNYILLEDFFNFHKEQLKKELIKKQNQILLAYLENQNLYDANKNKEPSNKKLTKEELEDLIEAYKMANNLKCESYYKKIE